MTHIPKVPDITSNYSPATPSYTMLSAASVVSKYGVAKSTADFMTYKHWHIAEDWRDIFLRYYILRWQPEYFQAALKDGTLEREGVIYQVVYHNCDSVMVARTQYSLLLSFRELQEEYKMQPVVLVTIS